MRRQPHAPNSRPRDEPLAEHLRGELGDGIELSLDEVASLLGGRLPARAARPGWWRVPPRKTERLSRAWHRAGFNAELVSSHGLVRFRRRTRIAPGWEHEGYGRWIYSTSGRRRRYSAIDPMGLAFLCPCGKSSCVRMKVLPLRDHMTALYRFFSHAYDEQYALDPGWTSVGFGLKLAASVRDVEAYTGYVEDPMMFALCESSGDYEDAESEMASKYVAAASVFNFLWQAYERAVGLTEPSEMRGLLKDGRLGERGRRLFEAHPELDVKLLGFKDALGSAKHHCRNGGLFTARLAKVEARCPDLDFVAAAELVREFRNFFAHAEDEVPSHPDWGDALTSFCRLARFYAVGRLILFLIQAFVWHSVSRTALYMDEWSEDIEARDHLAKLHVRRE